MSAPVLTAPAFEIADSDHWLSPPDLIARLDIRLGMTVAEIGAGAGFFTFSIARRVGPSGGVFAIEWRTWIADRLLSKLAAPGALDNIIFIEGRAAGTHLRPACCNLVILADIWHELERRDAALDEAKRLLRADGRLAILNWRPDALCPPGPPIEHRVSMATTICDAELRSWSLVKSAYIGADGYLLVFEITDESVQS